MVNPIGRNKIDPFATGRVHGEDAINHFLMLEWLRSCDERYMAEVSSRRKIKLQQEEELNYGQ
jgi:hypothetical protein